MSSERGFRLLIVGRHADLGLALSAASALLGDRGAKGPSAIGPPLIGVWLDPVLAQQPPATLGRAPTTQEARFEIYESVSMEGIWTLCAVSPLSASAGSDCCVLRERLIASLMRERATYAQPAAAAMFAPVFDEHASLRELNACMRRLRCVFPGRILDEIILCDDVHADAGEGRRRHFDRVD
jgi:hypothetical protein